MPTVADALPVTEQQRAALEQIARSGSLPHRQVVQARALLLAADGVGTNEVARRCQTTNDSVRSWRRRFATHGIEGIGRIAPGRGRKSWLPPGTVEAIVKATLNERPEDGSTHWTTRLLAERLGVGKDTVARVWRDHNLKPWKTETFKISNDPHFEEKLVDVVGLYLEPAGAGRRVQLRREDPGAGSRPHTAEPSDEAWTGRDDDARLQAERDRRSLRRLERRHR